MSTDSQPTRAFAKIASPNPTWKNGDGASIPSTIPKVAVDPFGEGRLSVNNYRLLTDAVLPRPIALVSTINSRNEKNLAPFSYFTIVNSDPPIFVIGISQGQGLAKDTAQNIIESGELTISIISEWFVEAANHTSVNAPHGVDEWQLSGLTPEESIKVRPPIVKESGFSIEAKLLHHHDWFSKSDPKRKTGALFIVEGVQFHARQDLINEELNSIDIEKLRPVSRLGGTTYSRTTEGFDLSSPLYE